MPFVTVATNNGSADFHYDIATPAHHSAASIEQNLPTIFFIHSSWVADEIFEPQFSDPNLRQFNLVTVQMRGYGETHGKIGDAPYTPKESADDLWNVMEALSLPCVHIFAVSMGTAVALELAGRHPERVLSMTLAALISQNEDESVIYGRKEVWNTWLQAHTFVGKGVNEILVNVDDAAICDMLLGVCQLSFNNEHSTVIDCINGVGISRAKQKWSGSRENLDEGYRASLTWHLDAKPIPEELLAKIRCHVSLVHFREDIGYPLGLTYELASRLTLATAVEVYEIAGAHLGSLTNPKELNPILQRTVLETELKLNKRSFPDVPPDAPSRVTPFTHLLAPFVDDDISHGDI